ncbi:BlaI/MecI/CopY family transcriptional regulator [Pedobacter africanus]|uniref:Predicted transcriptional regulator n=1 Tax=Pedobacter africanus TaxID=151894 RepID=A0A1W1Z2L5_9SPHI|nr:BlaI/MecI/CopY family transcriptional regulator [Pedobacter africanus]SMC42321.1 Predicted transcriptional regulator [Pedobacter africanus]
MVQLTKAEEQIMQVLWTLGEGTVQDIREKMETPKAARTTVATVLSILENKGFVKHNSVGRANVYLPAIAKEAYSKTQLFGLLKNYFNDSFSSMASFFAKESNYTVEELDRLIRDTKEELKKEK